MRKMALDCVYKLSKLDDRVIFVGSDLGPGVLDKMKTEFPDRFFMEGVSEQYIVGMAAGLAMEGFIPYVNTIATFLTRRCYEQVAVDLCIHDLPVRLIANGGGGVYAPLGPTHLAIEDIAIMRALPNMAVVAPCDADEMNRLMMSTLEWPHPIYIRLGKGGDKIVSEEKNGFELGKSIKMRTGIDGLFITTGVMTQLALETADILKKDGVDVGVLHVHTIKPFDHAGVIAAMKDVRAVVTVEEHIVNGGLGSAVLESCSELNPELLPKISRIGIPDKFATEYGSQNSLLKHWGITSSTLVGAMMKKLGGAS
ncbi:MAG: transketolase [Actinobacteria bacterium]|jgi:transketolase|nr:transketolase [Actinomycetota bacterium]NDC90574.1 transketolase [Acidimicrobiia bacterium]NDD71956.1 transketolase [Actinomycetota bacterium]NDF66689.1 transketolase [Actinomycetota bacterium]HBQ52040.1 transketolase [Acidimicrobium sp.]